MQVLVRGDGIAARCCIRLLEASGLRVGQQHPIRPALPAIMVGATTQRLFGDAFGREDLFRNQVPIDKRIVAWGPGAEPRVLPHSAVVVREAELLQSLEVSAQAEEVGGAATWEVVASRPLPDGSSERPFGARTASAIPVRLKAGAERAACWIESLENGWAFLIPGGADTGWLLAVGICDEGLPRASRLLAPQIAEVAGSASKFPSHPRIAWPLCGPGWLGCGTAALSFDPLCGDGSGHAIREGILAAALLRAVDRGESVDTLLAHYRSRLLAGFARHLETCETFYRTGGATPWWQEQRDAARAGLEWCAKEMRGASATRYRLRGFELEPAFS